ncbi:unnamed protein product [Ectocarpus sp. 12 AP-2014]
MRRLSNGVPGLTVVSRKTVPLWMQYFELIKGRVKKHSALTPLQACVVSQFFPKTFALSSFVILNPRRYHCHLKRQPWSLAVYVEAVAEAPVHVCVPWSLIFFT